VSVTSLTGTGGVHVNLVLTGFFDNDGTADAANARFPSFFPPPPPAVFPVVLSRSPPCLPG
jgi:hypothetical protein